MGAGTFKTTPDFSVIVPVHNDWGPLADCLESLRNQNGNPDFEVIVVDDGSRDDAPNSIRRYSDVLPLRIVRQPHAGVAAARNRGAQDSNGTTLVFTDADCRLAPTCLSVLNERISQSPQHNYFQLRLTGDPSNLLGKAEDLRLEITQDHLIQPNGCIRYLNTSGFAVRRSAIDPNDDLFDPTALRSEDTLLLTHLVQRGELPLFIGDAVVRHTIQMSFAECIKKDVRVAWLEAKTFERIAAKGVQVRIRNRQRIAVLRSGWRTSANPSIGRSAWLVLAGRQALQRAISVLYRWSPLPTRFRSGEESSR